MQGDRKSPAFPPRAAGNPLANRLRDLVVRARQRMQPTGLSGGREQAPEARFQSMADNAPVGAVGAPGGLQAPRPRPTQQDALQALLGAGAVVPGPLGDVAGPLADAYMYATDPESRTAGNAALSAMGLLPGVPSVMGMASGGEGGGRLPRLLSLFSGGGSYETALKGKVQPVGAIEYDPDIGAHYKAAHGSPVHVGDVRNVDFTPYRGKVDVLHASPVCKRASAAKCAAGEQELDMETAKATARALEEVQPRVFTLENVPQYQKFGAFKAITDKLSELGYNWDVVRYDAAQLGAPSRRDRIMLRASKEPLPPARAAQGVPKDWFGAIEDLLPGMPKSTLANWQRKRLAEQGVDLATLDRPLLVGGGSGLKGKIPHASSGSAGFTVKATPKEFGSDRVVMPDGTTYTLTPRAYARLLGLPDDYPLPDNPRLAKTIVGNAMAPAMTRHVVEPLLDTIKRGE